MWERRRRDAAFLVMAQIEAAGADRGMEIIDVYDSLFRGAFSTHFF